MTPRRTKPGRTSGLWVAAITGVLGGGFSDLLHRSRLPKPVDCNWFIVIGFLPSITPVAPLRLPAVSPSPPTLPRTQSAYPPSSTYTPTFHVR